MLEMWANVHWESHCQYLLTEVLTLALSPTTIPFLCPFIQQTFIINLLIPDIVFSNEDTKRYFLTLKYTLLVDTNK